MLDSFVMHVVHRSPCGGAVIKQKTFRRKKHYLILCHHQRPIVLTYESNRTSLRLNLKAMQMIVQLFLYNYTPSN